jgi:hypothetical protein
MLARPRSSEDRAPASGAGCAGSSPAGGTVDRDRQRDFTETDDDALLPAASNAVAVKVYVTFACLGTAQPHAYGAVVSVHFNTPLTRNSTRTTPRSSVAVAVIVIVFAFVTVEPFAGDVIVTVGRVVSGTVAVIVVLPELPAWAASPP